MQKRGQLVNKALIVIIASAIIVISFMSAGTSLGRGDAYYKLAVAKDVALTIDMLYSLQGDIAFTYPNDISDLIIQIDGNSVKVSSKSLDKLDVTSASYEFAGIALDKLNVLISGKKFVRFEKSGNKLSISGVDS